ncbi:aspartate dehydrogenase [Pseudogracilibacillus sp. SO10305]|uniref:aspartate dehydrogenase n=1 Tax=Pseudogracilibacillus sp. SO10305 TaxID=3098292 RepID=UPI00300E5C0A
MKVGIVGAGAIANYILEKEKDHTYEVTSILVRDMEKYREISNKYHVTLYTDVQAFIDSGVDIVVEAATVEAVQAYVPQIIEQKDVVIISIGAFVDDAFTQEVTSIAEKNNRNIFLPSGSIGGLDLVQNVLATKNVEHVSLTTRKAAHTLVREPITEEKIAFQGSAREAIAVYPKNINISIALSLAGIGFDRTKVTMIADPHATKNTHTIEVEGAFGKASFTIENNPLPSNPSTSYLAAISVIGTLERQHGVIRIGQ